MASLTNNPVMDFKQVDDDLYIDPVLGDFVMVPSDNQHIKDILQSYPGWWKNAIQLGAGLPALLKGKINVALVESRVKSQLESDGYKVGRPKVTISPNGVTNIIPNAERI